MIPRLLNIQRLFSEITVAELDCVAVSDSGGKAAFGSREGIAPSEVIAYIQQTSSDFAGEFLVEVWKKGVKGTALRYVVANGGAVNGTGNGGGSMNSDIVRLMEANFNTRLELEKLRMERVNGKEESYMPQALGMLQQLIAGKAAPAPVATPAAAVTGNDDDEGDDDAPDELDHFAAEEPDALEIAARLVKLKRTNPAMYQQAKDSLKGMTS